MNAALIHRGPDGEGKFYAPHLSMAMRRLSIIDLDSGWQPLYNEDSSIAVMANGEIYNYLELRDELQKQGHVFKTESDVETIAHLYEEYGIDCVKHLRGMFAIALWDDRQKSLFLARDRMGEKTIYLYEGDKEVVFASEMKSILTSRKVPFEFDPVAINLYFHLQYIPGAHTAIKGIRKLLPGHRMLIKTNPWQVQESCYWSMDDIEPIEGDPVKMVREKLEEIASIIIRSDVPVGVALSGGIDSSLIAALAKGSYSKTLCAFSVGYPGVPAYDERSQARELAKKLDMPFYDVELGVDEHTDLFAKLVYMRDDPIADISGFGYYAVSRKAREVGVPVLLQGQGGDELFWGYHWSHETVFQSTRKMNAVKRGMWRSFTNYTTAYSGEKLKLKDAFKEWMRDYTSPADQMVCMDILPFFLDGRNKSKTHYAKKFLEALTADDDAGRVFRKTQPWDHIPASITELIMQTYLRENGISQGDRLSMSNSIELRLPLVDYRLIETVIGLRKNYDDHTLPPKYWLVEAVKDILPAEVLTRPKRGFQPPAKEWNRNIFKKYGNLLPGGMLESHNILKSEACLELSNGAFPKGIGTPYSFKALVLELWAREMSAI